MFSISGAAAGDGAGAGDLQANWIWLRGADVHAYNQTVVARKQFRLDQPRRAVIRITADSYYRLLINNEWINDGPARAWPDHYQYDVIDVTPYLVDGANELRVIARYYGVGDFHRIPQQAGLLAQLDVELSGGKTVQVITDGSWEMAQALAWIPNTPKVSIQMEPLEVYDGRLENRMRFGTATVLFGAHQGPWKGLAPRDTPLLTKKPFPFKSFLDARVVKAEGWNYLIPAARLVNPGVMEANHTVSQACGMATVLNVNQNTKLQIQSEGMRFAIDGLQPDRGEIDLAVGRHLMLAFVRDLCDHEKHKGIRFMNPRGFTLENPVAAGHENPWALIRFSEFTFATNDLRWIGFRHEDAYVSGCIARYQKLVGELLASVRDNESFNAELGNRAALMSQPEMFLVDATWQFQQRTVTGDGQSLVTNPVGLIHNNADATVVRPAADGDVELLYDLGEQNCGYYRLELEADAGVIVDIFGVEYITPDGRIQHTWGNRNGLRYITRDGVNRFTSLKRRSGRYLFVTLRNQKSPVRIRNLVLIESTYPVQYTGSFSCSDARLDRIWDISTRTLKLCMEDTFTDCPLYEQTHWVGDARNESLLAYGVFGATDLAKRCIEVTAQSLDRYPIAGCQTPSCWDCLLPAWSFLWGISTWDYYWHTGDRQFVRAIYPAVIRNLRGAESFVSDRDLFAGPFWNMFDWTGADQGPKTVLHNSLFMVGAIDAALRQGKAIGDTTHAKWLNQLRARLVRGINKLWDPDKQAYPDSVRDDGSISPGTCQHTSFLSILYDVIDPANLNAARRNILSPPDGMVRIGSPFAMLYLYETYEKLGLEDQVITEIYKNYLPMVESGATTVWESFPSGTTGSGGFPTRSHCHAWSSAPTRFLNRIILGVKDTSPGCASVKISPRLNDLEWARGTVATARGPVSVTWKRTGNALDVQFTAPSGMNATFERNNSMTGLAVTVNGKQVQ